MEAAGRLAAAVDMEVQELLLQLQELPAVFTGQRPAPLPLQFMKGGGKATLLGQPHPHGVHVQKCPQAMHPRPRARTGSSSSAGSASSQGSAAERVVRAPQPQVRASMQALVFDVPGLLQKLWSSTASARSRAKEDPMMAELRREEQQCRASRKPFVDTVFRMSTGGRVTKWLRPHEVTQHDGHLLCEEVGYTWNIFSQAPRPRQSPHVDWRLFREAPRSNDVKQGGLGDCWFLSSLAVLAEYQDGRFLRALLPNQHQASACGAYLVRLCLGGFWRGILIDDRLPCVDVGRGVTQLAYCATKRLQLWASLIEKAFAKACGSYEAMKGGEAGRHWRCLRAGLVPSSCTGARTSTPTCCGPPCALRGMRSS